MVRIYRKMTVIEKRLGRFTIFYYASPLEPVSLLRDLDRARVVAGKGRGGIKILETGGSRLVARKYVHGGLFRALTRDVFLKRRRVTSEAEIMAYLQNGGFPVVAPFCAIIENLFVVRRLHLVTKFEENTMNFLEYLQRSGRMQRLRAVKKLAESLWRLELAGVYHPDLHLRNVLVTPERGLIFLDFDRARRRTLTEKDVERMFLRLDRFVDKMGKQGQLFIDRKEKALFLRAYLRLSGKDFAGKLERTEKMRGYLHRTGWLFESLLYGRFQ